MPCKDPEKILEKAYSFFSEYVIQHRRESEVVYYREILNEILKGNQSLQLNSPGKKIIVTSDPMEEFDDIVMIRFVLYNLNADITIVLSGGAHSPQERLDNVKDIFGEQFREAVMDVPLTNGARGTITFKADEETLDLQNIEYDLFVNCGPTLHENLTKIIDNLRKGSQIITVGANSDGTAGAGVNQKSTANGELQENPEWNNEISRAKTKNCIVKNLDVQLSRFVLFPNPKDSVFMKTEYGELATKPEFFNEAVATTGMFISSRPPPKFAGRVNFGNSILCLEMAEDVWKGGLENIKTSPFYKNGLVNIENYCKWANSDFHKEGGAYNEVEGQEDLSVEITAAIPLMTTALLGGMRKVGLDGLVWKHVGQLQMRLYTPEQQERLGCNDKGVLEEGGKVQEKGQGDYMIQPPIFENNGGYFFGSDPVDRDSKMNYSWVEGGIEGIFGDSVRSLKNFTPAYDPLAVIMGVNEINSRTGGKRCVKNIRNKKKNKKNTKNNKKQKKRHNKKTNKRN